MLAIFDQICSGRRGIRRTTLEDIITLAVELAREGREGRKIGTLFVIGDAEAVLARSRTLILDPLKGHAAADKRVSDPNARETLKELAQLDGAFAISDEGVAISATRYLNASAQGLDLPLGLGTRHMAAASITRETGAVAVVVSESAIVRVFDNGELVGEILPELWLLSRHSVHLAGPYSERTDQQVTVVSKTE